MSVNPAGRPPHQKMPNHVALRCAGQHLRRPCDRRHTEFRFAHGPGEVSDGLTQRAKPCAVRGSIGSAKRRCQPLPWIECVHPS